MRRVLTAIFTLTATLGLGAGAAQAVVVDVHAIGQSYVHTDMSGAPYVTYPTDQSNYVGVAMVPGTRSTLTTDNVPYVATSGSCKDPRLAPYLVLPNTGICSHGGPVMHANETFALTWDPLRRYWAQTRGYVEQFLSDVASGSNTLTSPYAVATQYTDSTGRAGNVSKYGGGCIDYGNPTNSDNQNTTCSFASSTQTGPGHNYPQNGCTPSGISYTFYDAGTNDTCLTDAQVRGEVRQVVAQTGMLGRTQPHYTPLVVVLLPPKTEVCLDANANLCSANSNVQAQFCSYHARLSVTTSSGSHEVDYLVQPWTAKTNCDEPDAPSIPTNPNPAVLGRLVGERLVSPISQAQIASMTNPDLNGWFALDGSEINDNDGCVPEGSGLDTVSVGKSSYLLQREFNNAGVIESDPATYFGCAPDVLLQPSFVLPSAVDQNDVVEFDGSTSVSTLLVPNNGYHWTFGDGTTATGPSVTHSYSKAGDYRVTLTVTDRGGNVRSLSQTIEVLGSNGKPGGGGSSGSGGSSHLHVQLQLLPQSYSSVLHQGLAVRVTSNEAADGFATLMIGRAAARRAHIKTGKGPMVTIGRGTVSGVKHGTTDFRVHLDASMAKKLAHLKNVTLTLRLQLVGADNSHVTIDSAGHY